MGIRIKKVIGYGLTDVNSSGGVLCDDRFNLDSGYFKQNNKFNKEDLIKYLANYTETKKVEIGFSPEIHYLKQLEYFSFDNYIHYNFEYGDPSVVLFQPINDFNSQWTRNDDTIDYCEAQGLGNKPTVKQLKFPIYPYVNWLNIKTLLPYTVLNGFNMPNREIISPLINNSIEGFDKEEYAKFRGYDSAQALIDNIVPEIPENLVKMLQYLKVFKDDATIYKLKPLIYTYWN